MDANEGVLRDVKGRVTPFGEGHDEVPEKASQVPQNAQFPHLRRHKQKTRAGTTAARPGDGSPDLLSGKSYSRRREAPAQLTRPPVGAVKDDAAWPQPPKPVPPTGTRTLPGSENHGKENDNATYVERLKPEDSAQVCAPRASAMDRAKGGHDVCRGEVFRDLTLPPSAGSGVIEACSLELHGQHLGHLAWVRLRLVNGTRLAAPLLAYHEGRARPVADTDLETQQVSLLGHEGSVQRNAGDN